MARRYLDAPRQPVTGSIATPAYLVAQFSSSACDAIYLPVKVLYPAVGSRIVFSTTRQVRLVPGSGPTSMILPTYALFSGVGLPRAYPSRLPRLARIAGFWQNP